MTSDFDTIIGLERARRDIFKVSKTTWAGIVRTLPVVQLSERRKGIRKSDIEAWINARTIRVEVGR